MGGECCDAHVLDLALALLLALGQEPLQGLLRQYLYVCTGKASKLALLTLGEPLQRLLRQYLYFCTNKARKLRTSAFSRCRSVELLCVRSTENSSHLTSVITQLIVMSSGMSVFSYFCTSQASKALVTQLLSSLSKAVTKKKTNT